MAFCTKCGHKLDTNDLFCSKCGYEVKEIKKSRDVFYDGEIHKCPNCGGILSSFSSTCSICGYELRGTKVSSVVNDFSIKLEKIESSERKIDLITNFHIPNTKEDIYEFFVLAVSYLNAGSCETVEAWEVKLEQAYHKAFLVFGESSEFNYLHELYTKTLRKKNKKWLKILLSKGWRYIVGSLMVIFGLSMIILGIFLVSKENNPDSPLYAIPCLGLVIMISSIFVLLTKKTDDSNE